MHELLVVAAAFAASAVEMVEALTVVLAVGVTRGWRSAGWGVTATLAALTVIVVILGPALSQIPLDALRLVVGTTLLIFGLQWLRKAVLRATGLKAKHDEDAIYAEEIALLRAHGSRPAHDWYTFTVAFKGVFLEGLEVAFIIVTIGGAQHSVGLAALGAFLALIVVLIAGIKVHAPLSRPREHPEVRGRRHAHVVRHLLGLRRRRRGVARRGCGTPGRDRVRRRAFVRSRRMAAHDRTRRTRSVVKYLARFGHFWYDFIVGDDWTVALAIVTGMTLTTYLAHHGHNPWPLMPVAVAITLTWSVWRIARAQTQRRK